MKKVLFLMLLFLSGVAVSVKSQVTIGKEKPAEKFSALEIVSNGENGLRLPRMTTAERDKLALSGQTLAEGLVIFNTDTKCMDFWNGSKWTNMCADVSGRYLLNGKTCFDVNQTEGTTTNGCKPKSSRPNDFALTRNFIYTFSSPTGSAYSELRFITDDPTIATVTYTGETATVTFANDIVSRATGKDKTQALKLIITAQYKDNNNADKQISLIVSVQDCACGCSVKSTLPAGWLTFMCHNLGADGTKSIAEQMNYTPTGNTDATVYGDLYQWGRQTDGHEKRTSPNYPTNDISAENGSLATAALDGNGQVPSAHNAYGKFIKNTPDLYGWRISQCDTLWKDNAKTVNDPCPTGWRVPTYPEWGSIVSGEVTQLNMSGGTATGTSGNKWTWNGGIATHGYTVSTDNGATTALFLPAAGYRAAGSGSFTTAGSNGHYWSSTTRMYLYPYNLSFLSSSNVNPATYASCGYGYSVRCVSE